MNAEAEKREKSLAPLRSCATDSPVISVDERPSPRRYPLFFFFLPFPFSLLTFSWLFFLDIPFRLFFFFSSHLFFFGGKNKTGKNHEKKNQKNQKSKKKHNKPQKNMVVVHIRFTSEGPLFFLQCLTASTARPSRARGLYQRRYIYTCMYIYSTGRKKEKKKANGVCVCVLCIYLHASGHPSKRRAAASASRPFFIGAVMLGAS